MLNTPTNKQYKQHVLRSTEKCFPYTKTIKCTIGSLNETPGIWNSEFIGNYGNVQKLVTASNSFKESILRRNSPNYYLFQVTKS